MNLFMLFEFGDGKNQVRFSKFPRSFRLLTYFGESNSCQKYKQGDQFARFFPGVVGALWRLRDLGPL